MVGAGPAGLSCALTAAERGHAVTLFEAGERIGGQLNLARNVAGKEEFDETLRYYAIRLAQAGVDVRLSAKAAASDLAHGFDEVVVATGARPRVPDIAGIDHAKCVSYADLLSGKRQAGQQVVIIGAGGIGFDVAEYLLQAGNADDDARDAFLSHWGVEAGMTHRGALTKAADHAPPRKITMLQRKAGRMGRSLGVSTGWILRLELARANVKQISGVAYERIDDAGVHITVDGAQRTIPADTVVIAAGQDEERSLYADLAAAGRSCHLIGGAERSAELDAVRAIDEGLRLALTF
ncbi:MAG: FAD-dependent oxidoreductase [Hyphomicrobiaceae bacterium]